MQNYTIRLTKVTGLIIFGQQSTRTYTGTKDQLAEVYKKVQIYNIVAGWWGIVAIIWNLMALYRNSQALKKLNSL